MAVMTTQNAQNEQGLAQIREAQAQTQQVQAQIMQMMGMIFCGSAAATCDQRMGRQVHGGDLRELRLRH